MQQPVLPQRSGAQWLQGARAAVLPPATTGRVLRLELSVVTYAWEQSDRPYEPFLPMVSHKSAWLDLATGVEGTTVQGLPQGRAAMTLATEQATFFARDSMTRPNAVLHRFARAERALNPWAVVLDWSRRGDSVRVAGWCISRGAKRVVLASNGEELHLAADGTPAMLVRREDELLWGDVRVEYLWNTWWAVKGGGAYPLAAFRLVEGTTQLTRAVPFAGAELIDSSAAPRLAAPVVAAAMDTRPGAGMPAWTVDTVRVGDNAFLLKRPDYTEMVALRRDTVFLLDATGDVARARQDSSWIARLFPGRHPMVVVVTDLAWPHVGSAAYWARAGAVLVSHESSRDFLARVVQRGASGAAGDNGATTKRPSVFRFRPVTDSLRLAGGELVAYALQGLSTEGAIGVWLANARTFWAGDYVQQTDQPSVYARDVVRTIVARGLQPERICAQHVPMVPWTTIVNANAGWSDPPS
ncbi:MAG: hypothetical protein U0164_24035 [Gemmatimonadaceae bacterium]